MLSIFTGANILIGISSCAVFFHLANKQSIVPGDLAIFLATLSALIPTVTHLYFYLTDNAARDQIYTSELNRFKMFIHNLYHSSSDVEVCNKLRDFICQSESLDSASIFCMTSLSDESGLWIDATPETNAVCSINKGSCPLLVKNESYVLGNIQSNTEKCPLNTENYSKGNYLCFLIEDEENSKYILQLYSKKVNPFSRRKISLIESYIEVTKPILASKRTVKILKRKATTDYLTKLYNRSFLDTYLQNQIDVANLTKQPLSIIMIDVDCFKNINDTYGHASGDNFLVSFARIITKCVRKSDVVVRYGGDEFVVILPSTDTKTAYAVAERIRRNLEKTMILSNDNKNILSATCSLGVSTYPTLCSSMEELLKTADMAMYNAKSSNRNRTMVYNQ